jgi:ABC-type molybdate transport system permease subunit
MDQTHPQFKVALPWLVVPAAFVAAYVSANLVRAEINTVPAIVVAIIATLWCRIDSADRGKPLSNLQTGVVFVLYPIAVPLYLINAHGRRGLIGAMVALLLGVVAFFAVGFGFGAATS